MDKEEAKRLLEDFGALPARPADPELVAIEAALFVEQTFGIEIPDSEISPERLGSQDAVERYVAERMEKR